MKTTSFCINVRSFAVWIGCILFAEVSFVGSSIVTSDTLVFRKSNFKFLASHLIPKNSPMHAYMTLNGGLIVLRRKVKIDQVFFTAA